ncbi:MAG TPA: GNAT family N-acetyltransferase [Streptosporangiaceae bacterium]|nr:GNAT family N-acetyltransferase [Streptosporangiaceae bacterium]
MSGQDFVRAARGSDAAGVARVQVECWRNGYAGVIPDSVLAELTSEEAAGRWQQRWAEAIAKPPTSRHRVLVATAGPERAIAGFASAGPASDEDRWPATDGELYELHVAPGRSGQGHGGRLLNAVADTLAEDRFTQVSAWVLEADTALREFLESAGWAADGARSQLDMGVRVPIVRLHTALEVPPE